MGSWGREHGDGSCGDGSSGDGSRGNGTDGCVQERGGMVMVAIFLLSISKKITSYDSNDLFFHIGMKVWHGKCLFVL